MKIAERIYMGRNPHETGPKVFVRMSKTHLNPNLCLKAYVFCVSPFGGLKDTIID